MGEKRFRTRRQWHNTVLMLLAVPFAVVIGLLIGTLTSVFWPLYAFIMLTAVGFSVALLRDRSTRSTYAVSDDSLFLIDSAGRVEVRAEDITDASLIDRSGARDYIRQKLSTPSLSSTQRKERVAAFTRFCTVDIGLRSFTLGVGRGMIDRMPNAKHDLVLLRLRNGEDHLLSPQYNQDLVEIIGRMLRKPGGA
ncbi:MAG: hypothetical protein ABI432_04915 [Flavobacteriales bacterium]